ncbi:MAG: winged helix DNA-binding domain-containing protein [Firmicutes bacterium]|nr:winged helix DNA-binding domain-containing protein [Bacillota bacterium]
MIQISKSDARKFLLTKHHLYGKKVLRGKEDILAFIRQVGCLQYDPIDVCGKNAELVLQSRIKNFLKSDLYDLLYQERALVDYFDKNLAIFPIEDWPYFAREREMYAEKGRSKDEIDKVCHEIIETIRVEGPKTSSELEYEHKVDWYWGHTKLSRAALELLYFKGELGIHSKKGTNKRYDLMTNLYPESLVTAPDPHPDLFEHLCWRVKRRIGAVGMLWNRPSDAWLNIRELKSAERKGVFEVLEQRDEIIPVQVEDVKEPFYILALDLDLLHSVRTLQDKSNRVEFLAPLDNFLWDRKLICALFDFNYKWEIYTPEVQRVFGYYVLPMLYGSDFIGRIEMVCQRKEKTLTVKNVWYEEGFKPTVGFKKRLDERLKAFMVFNDCSQVKWMERDEKK